MMTCYSVFVSLGPACLSANILKSVGLRKFSLPLDWARTGGYHLHDLLKLSPEQFYERNIAVPNLKLEQLEVPSEKNRQTSELKHTDHKYGFPYYYNPHRLLGGSDKEYYMRCLERLEVLFKEKDLIFNFLGVDIPTRRGETYFREDGEEALQYIVGLLDEKFRERAGQGVSYKLKIARIHETDCLIPSCRRLIGEKDKEVIKLEVPRGLREMNEIVGKMIYSREDRMVSLRNDPLKKKMKESQ